MAGKPLMDSISLFSGVGGLDLGLRRPVVEVTLNFFCVFVYAINVCVSPYFSHVQQPCCSAGSASQFFFGYLHLSPMDHDK